MLTSMKTIAKAYAAAGSGAGAGKGTGVAAGAGEAAAPVAGAGAIAAGARAGAAAGGRGAGVGMSGMLPTAHTALNMNSIRTNPMLRVPIPKPFLIASIMPIISSFCEGNYTTRIISYLETITNKAIRVKGLLPLPEPFGPQR